MRALLVGVVMLSLVVPAAAQGMGGKHHQSEAKSDTEKKPKADENGYKASLSRMPDGKYDPWRAMR
jgi:hypothetical protein